MLKTLKGQEYYYYQHARPGRIVQSSVGRRSPALDRVRLDLLTPQTGSRSRPVPIARFHTAAQPLPYLDYLIDEPQQAKSSQDLDQAAQLIEVLAEDRPGDLSLAWETLVKRKSLSKAAQAGLAALTKRNPHAHAARQDDLAR